MAYLGSGRNGGRQRGRSGDRSQAWADAPPEERFGMWRVAQEFRRLFEAEMVSGSDLWGVGTRNHTSWQVARTGPNPVTATAPA
jgi:hypothetical protein